MKKRDVYERDIDKKDIDERDIDKKDKARATEKHHLPPASIVDPQIITLFP